MDGFDGASEICKIGFRCSADEAVDRTNIDDTGLGVREGDKRDSNLGLLFGTGAVWRLSTRLSVFVGRIVSSQLFFDIIGSNRYGAGLLSIG